MERGERSAGTSLARLMIAHLVAYPVALFWVIASMPFCFPIVERQLTEASGSVMLWGIAPMPAEAAIVVRATLVVGAIAFVVEHAFGVAWALAKDALRGRRRFVRTSAALGLAALLLAAVGWGWFLIRYGS
jgi:hypothetical protein